MSLGFYPKDNPYWDSFIVLNTLLYKRLLVLWIRALTITFPVTLKADLLLYSQIKSVLASLFVEILFFGFCLLNSSECVAYLAVHDSLIYSYPKMLPLFLSNLELNSSFKKIFLYLYLGFIFALFFAPGSS